MEFRTALRNQIMQKVTDWIGPSTPIPHIVTVEKRLKSVEKTQLPMMVCYVRQVDAYEEPEIQTPYTQDVWNVHLYYLDVDTNWDTGEDRMDSLIGVLRKKFENNRRLENFRFQGADGVEEYVWDVKVASVLFDGSGQEGDYSFVSEFYLNVYTDRTEVN